MGAGVIYKMNKTTGDAFIITNYHVVFDPDSDTRDGISDSISVYLYGGEYEELGIKAEYVGGSLHYDIAVLKISGSELLKNSHATPVSIFDSEEISLGESAIAIGNPKGLGIAATLGVVSVDSEYIEMTGADGVTDVEFRVMRVDTAVNSGNSGGGLFNSSGELIGIVNAKLQNETVENIAYAIPSNLAVSVAENIIYNCLDTNIYQPQCALLNIMIQITDSHAEYDSENARIKIVEEISVYSVENGGAAGGKLMGGDILKSATLDGVSYEITRLHHLDFLLDARPGDTITFTIDRDGIEKTVQITLKESDFIAK